VGFEQREVGSLEFLECCGRGECFEAEAKGGLGGDFFESEGFSKSASLVMAKKNDVVVVGAPLDEEADPGGEDVGIANAVGAGLNGFFEEFAESAEFGDEFANEVESVVGVDFS
jgi:hypothetical protein